MASNYPLVIGTGLSGLLGSRIVELLEKQFKFINFSLETNVDITNLELLKRKFKENKEAEIVLHLAAFTDVDAAWQQKKNKNSLCYRINVLGTRNIAKLCAKHDKYLVHFSTDFIFNGRKKTIYTEYDRPDPIEWYGQTKHLAEQEVKKSGCQYVIIRTAFPFKAKRAPRRLEPRKKLDLVRKIIKLLKKNKEFLAFSDQIITPTFIDDIAKAVKVIFKTKPKGIFNVVGSTALSPYELALRVARNFGLPEEKIKERSLVEYLKQENARPRQRYLAISNFKLKDRLDVHPKSIREALKEMRKQIEG